ncbi:hypothetical protein HPC49_37360 [Pyxidicoccus fallax]|uniref:Uncharacterized protein n=1 Tax=Pyxidicoccus fallax TaxID=394095 RepID=A0A848LMY9_9BACT|nr:hypothetical protein [Pyxidicoccus fallax]NMO19049.1 hypothetical protein [Pyxidicoccus fallax]NPC83872.1 hypothetical protein [Pyxidicoccus fallax]
MSTLTPVLRSVLVAAVLLGTATARAEDVIHGIVAVTHEGECTSALGYVVEVGEADKVAKAAEQKARAQYPALKRLNHKDNDKKGKSLGRHVVVVSAGVGKPGCTGRAMGVGFGKDEAAALKDAKSHLGKSFPLHAGDVKVEHSQGY